MTIASDFKQVPAGLVPLSKKKAEALADEFGTLLAKVKNPAVDPKALSDTGFLDFAGTVFNLSPHLKDCAFKEPQFVGELLQSGFEATGKKLLEESTPLGIHADSEAALMTKLRIQKRRMALLCGLADLGGWWPGDEVTSMLSEFASASLSASLDFVLLAQSHSGKLELADASRPQKGSGLIVLGMGKLGACELNYSSDIDLMIFYDHQAAIKLNTDDPVTLFVRMVKQLIKIMQERTSDGYVFRMDLRLRPDPSSTPLVLPAQAALNYYEGQGQNWERAAMIKARPVAGDLQSARAFLKELEPFIWRKYLDYAAINDVHSIKRQIHSHKGHGEIAVKGHNIKLGRGGIREIEFFVQTQQLIAGGRNPELRERETISSLNSLAEHGWIEKQEVTELSQAYWFLRNLEHRVQMVSDEQVHSLPENDEDLKRIACMSGEANVARFARMVEKTLRTVEKHYADLFETAPGLSAIEGNLVFTGEGEDPDTIKTLAGLRFQRPVDIINIVKRWHVARVPALYATQARELLTELVPTLLQAFGKASNPDEVLFTFDRFLTGLPAGIQLFSILKNNPALAGLLVRILDAAPNLASEIARKPHVFDAMLEPQFEHGAQDRETLQLLLEGRLSRAPDYEMALDQARSFFSENRFLTGCQHFSGILSAEQVARAFSMLAEVMILGMLKLVRCEFEKLHGRVPGSQICILGMGRLGSCELTAASDLDLIFLYDYDESVDYSDGEKPLATTQYFVRLVQRFIAAMSSPTAEGVIFELDFRLRPSGNAGPLATHADAFLKYQKEEAWTWESQALTRARTVAGDDALCEKISGNIHRILEAGTGKEGLATEIRDMRMTIEREKGSKNVWDVKLVSGGLIDIEFLAQWIVLSGGINETPLHGTREIIFHVSKSMLPENHRETLLEAFDLYNKVLHMMRICIGNNVGLHEASPGFHNVMATSLDLPDLASCEAYLKEQQKSVRKIFNELLSSSSAMKKK